MPASHPLANKTELSLEDLDTQYLILYETHKNPAVIAQLQTLIIDQHAPDQFTFTDDPSCALTLVHAGMGISILPDLPPLRHTKLAYIPLKDWDLISYGIYCHNLKGQPVLKYWIEELKKIFSTDD